MQVQPPPLHSADGSPLAPAELLQLARAWALELGFQQLAVASLELADDVAHLERWIGDGWHGEMRWFERHHELRCDPGQLRPGTLSVLSVRMDYFPADAQPIDEVLDQDDLAYVSRYALGRDYHKVLRQRLQSLAERIAALIGPFGYRVYTDSAPLLEKALARNAGLGWIGKHTNLLNRHAGSWFFLGEMLTDLPLPADPPVSAHCGSCVRCIEVCPTQAIIGPYRLDARRCISYLSIEHPGSIPVELRSAFGNRIYGCDDCQMVCPWNRYAVATPIADFLPRHGLDAAPLLDLFAWDEAEFLRRTEGSAIRRIGHLRWLRNIAVALGNQPYRPAIVQALQARLDDPSEILREHLLWALEQQQGKRPS